MANRNFANSRIYTGHVMPVLLDCNFVVDSTNGNGLGLRNLKGPYIANAYMHTSATPAAGNPNPASGIIVIQMQDNYNRYLSGFSGSISALGSSVTSTTANTSYVITSLGTATNAQFYAVGVPANLIPSVGMAFVASASATIGGSATVAPSAATGSGIDHIEVLGDPNQSIAPNGLTSSLPSAIPGAQFILQCFSGGAITAPANGSVISLSFLMSNSSVLISGE
jgi:hypothetical protein